MKRLAKSIVSGIDHIVNFIALMLILLMMFLSCYMLWDSNQVFEAADAKNYEAYMPSENHTKSFEELQKINPDVFGWIRINDTNVNYPLLQAEDDDTYMNTDAEGNYSLSGSIFLHCANSPDFSDFNNLIYGHHMEKHKMFGDVGLFTEKKYFDEHPYGNLFFDGKDHGIEFYALLQADAYNERLFNVCPETSEAKVKKDYYIQVDMDEKLLDGKPQPPAFHEHMKLVLPSEDSQKPDAEAPQAEDAPIEVVGTWTDDTHTSCTWIVKADSFWKYTLKEYNYKPKDSNVKFSGWYNVRNSHEQGDNVNSWEAYPESGIKFTGRGIGRGGETLTIELENRYQKEGILTLNKFDESTGQGMEKINFAVSKNGVEEETVTTDKYGIAQLHIPLQDENKQNRTATETYLLRETNLPTGYVDTGDIQITVEIANGAFKITDAKLVDREANENQEAVKAPVDGKIDGKSVLLQRGDTSLNIRNFAKTGTLHIKKTWENPNDALTEKQVKIRLYQNGISTGQEFLLNEENGWEHTVDNVPLFQDRNPVEYKVEEIEIGKTHYSLEYGDGFLYYEVIYPEIQYFDSNGQQIFPKDENEFKDVSKMELEVQNLHFNLAERSFLKTDDLPRNRLAGAGFLFYKVPYDDVTKKYADDTGYTVDYDNTQSKDDIVLKKDGKTCTTYRSLETDENGMLQLPEDFENGRYWMVESVTPNKKDKADKTKTQYQDNFNLYMVDVESDILFLYEKSPMTNTWRAVSDRHIVNHPQKGGVTVEITKEVTGPLGNRKKPFDMEILYWEDGQKLRSKTIRTSLKHGDKVTLKNVDISSDIIITETVDTSKYAVSISKKEENDKYSNPVQATSNGNTAVMKQRIEAARGDVIKLKITNKNTESIPETGIHLAKNQQVCILLVISIAVGLIFWRKNKNKAMRR